MVQRRHVPDFWLLRDDSVPMVGANLRFFAKPKPRYTVGPLAGRARVLRCLAPAGVFDKQIRKMNQLVG
jgi:hypothetical protein